MYAAAAAVKSLQSCPTLCDPMDGSPPGSPVPGILQARTLEWVAISFSNAWKWKVNVKLLSRVWLFATPWTVAYQALPFKEFLRQEYWSGVPLPSPFQFILLKLNINRYHLLSCTPVTLQLLHDWDSIIHNEEVQQSLTIFFKAFAMERVSR